MTGHDDHIIPPLFPGTGKLVLPKCDGKRDAIIGLADNYREADLSLMVYSIRRVMPADRVDIIILTNVVRMCSEMMTAHLLCTSLELKEETSCVVRYVQSCFEKVSYFVLFVVVCPFASVNG